MELSNKLEKKLMIVVCITRVVKRITATEKIMGVMHADETPITVLL
jgi:hypothetical protein